MNTVFKSILQNIVKNYLIKFYKKVSLEINSSLSHFFSLEINTLEPHLKHPADYSRDVNRICFKQYKIDTYFFKLKKKKKSNLKN